MGMGAGAGFGSFFSGGFGTAAAAPVGTGAIGAGVPSVAPISTGGGFSGGGITNFAKQLGGIGTKILGASQQASGYRAAGAAAMAAAEYNAALVRLNRDRQLDETSREIDAMMSKQRVQAASSGLSTSSKSFLAVTSETLTAFEREIQDIRTDATVKQNQILFEGRSQQQAYNNRAAGATASAMTGVFNGIPSLLQGASNAFGGLGG